MTAKRALFLLPLFLGLLTGLHAHWNLHYLDPYLAQQPLDSRQPGDPVHGAANSGSSLHQPRVRKKLRVGHLPVTCHLTCPVTSWITRQDTNNSEFESWRYTSWPAMTEDIDAGNLDAAFLLAPLAMVMARQGTPVKIVHLGHRDGTAVVVPAQSAYHSFADLRGKRIAIPHRFSNQRILIEKLKREFHFTDQELTLIDYPPPEMPAGLRAGQFEAYIVGEPFAAKAEMDGTGRILYFTKDIWPNFISCVLIVTDRLIKRDPDLVRELVQGISASGLWLDQGPSDRLLAGVTLVPETETELGATSSTGGSTNQTILPAQFGMSPRMQAAVVAARREYYNQDPELLRWVLSRPPDRVKYTQLELAEPDFREIQQFAEELGFFSFRPVNANDPFGFADYCDPSFEQSGHWEVPLQEPLPSKSTLPPMPQLAE